VFRWRRQLILAGSMAVAVIASMPVQAATMSPSVTRANRVFRAYAERIIPNGQLRVIQGTRSATGECQTNVILPMEHPGDGPQAAAEIAQDPATCTATYRIGTPTEPVGPLQAPSGAAGAGESSGVPAESVSSGKAARARVARRAHHPRPRAHAASSYARAYFLTVIKFNSNEVPQTQAWVQTTVQWHYDGSCVVSPTPTGGWSNALWEPWGLGYSDFPSGWECGRTWFARGYELGNRYNKCGSGDAWIHIMRNTIDAWPSGGFTPYDGDTMCDNNIKLYNVDYWAYY